MQAESTVRSDKVAEAFIHLDRENLSGGSLSWPLLNA